MKYLILILLFMGCEHVPMEHAHLLTDCAGVAGGSAEEDMCAVCDSDVTNDCVQDCAGVWGGDATNLCFLCEEGHSYNSSMLQAFYFFSSVTLDGVY